MSTLDREFAGLVRAHTPRLLAVARAFAHGDEEAEDLLQEAWIVAHRQWPARHPGAPVGAWLHAIVLNIGRGRWRRWRRRERLLDRAGRGRHGARRGDREGLAAPRARHAARALDHRPPHRGRDDAAARAGGTA